MGRRKIEIQPITHERNRSVTFLKRKNGLFKKAYELGVLCSVDVAVIIFEERPGHHVKLYQYCSSDIQDIVQRHVRHDGEKDTRGPSDFSGNATNKIEDIGDDNDEDGDEDDDMHRNKRGRDGKPKLDMHVSGMEYGHRNVPIPPSLPMHGLGSQGGGQGLPISNVSNMRETKRTRLGVHPPHSRSPSDDPANGAYHYSTHNSGGPFGNTRHGTAGYHPSQTQHHQSNPQYTFLPPSNSPPSFDLPQGGIGLPSRGQGYGLPHRTGSSGPGPYDSPGNYGNMIGRGGMGIQNAGPANGSENLFSGLQQGGFPGIEWPVHGGGNTPSNGNPPAVSTSAAPQSSSATTDTSAQSSNPSWLDFLSGSNQPGATGRETMSWERGGSGTGTNPDLYSDRGRPGGGGSPMVGGIVGTGKRSPGGGLLGSPLGAVGARDDGAKEIGAS